MEESSTIEPIELCERRDQRRRRRPRRVPPDSRSRPRRGRASSETPHAIRRRARSRQASGARPIAAVLPHSPSTRSARAIARHLSTVASSRSTTLALSWRRPRRPSHRRPSPPWCRTASSSAPRSMITSCCFLVSLSKISFDMISGSSMNQYDLPRPVVRLLATSSRRNEIRLVDDVVQRRRRRSASPHRVRSMASTAWWRRPPGASCPSRGCRRGSSCPWRLPERRSGCRGCDAAGLPDPGQDETFLLRSNASNFLPTGEVFQAAPCL